jgi:uncharacterized protein (UPF0332 family)
MKVPNWDAWIKSKRDCKLWFGNYIKKKILRERRLNEHQHIKKAKHNLDFGNWVNEKNKTELPELFGDEKFYDWVVSAYYYSIYHASLALISAKGFSSKSHYATLCAIIWYYHHENKHLEEKDILLIKESIGEEDIEIITKTKELREKASYGISGNFEVDLVKQAQDNAVYFLKKVDTILNPD